MKKVLLIYAVLIAAIGIWYFAFAEKNNSKEHEKDKALEVSQHSLEFNKSFDKAMDDYYALTNAFVSGDTVAINQKATALKTSFADLKIDEMKKDSAIYQTAEATWDGLKMEVDGMITEPSIDGKKQSLNMLSDQLYQMLIIVKFDLHKIYRVECAGALGENSLAVWLSKEKAVKNPFINKDCGEIKDTINFIPAASTKK